MAITFCAPDRIQCSNCPLNVVNALRTCVLTVRQDLSPREACDEKTAIVTCTLVQTTVVELAVGGFPFMTEPSQDGKNFASILALNILEELSLLSYDLVTSMNLTGGAGISATWVFVDVKKHWKATQRIPAAGARPRTVLIGSDGYDRIRIVRSDADVMGAVEIAVKAAWKYGADLPDESRYGSTRIASMRLDNFPWYQRGRGDPALGESKFLLLELISQMAREHYILVCSTNVFGPTDSMIFAYDDTVPVTGDFCMVTLDANCVRLINSSPSQLDPLREALSMEKPVREHYIAEHHYEFAINDSPWIDIPVKNALSARQLVKNIIEVMASCGCYLIESLDVSYEDRSVLLFHRHTDGSEIECAAMALTFHSTFSLVGVPENIVTAVTTTFSDVYQPGVAYSDTNCLVLEGFPWTAMGESYRLHATAALLATIEEMQRHNWEVLASIDVAGRISLEMIKTGPHSLYFIQAA